MSSASVSICTSRTSAAWCVSCPWGRLVCAYAAGKLLGGFVAWLAGYFVPTWVYLFLFGVELA